MSKAIGDATPTTNRKSGGVNQPATIKKERQPCQSSSDNQRADRPRWLSVNRTFWLTLSIGVYPLRQLRKIIGHSEIRAVETFDFGRLNCDALVYVGPAAADGSLQFQSGSDGQFQLTSGPTGYTVLDSADDTAALKIAATCPPSHATLICPCMDVSSKDVADLVAAGEHDLEVIKRLTSCGMGPCQGVPCWHSLKAFVCASTGKDPSELPLPTLRPPRRAMTVAQAAGLAELVDPLK